MTALHAAISAALDHEQALAEAVTPGPWKGGWIFRTRQNPDDIFGPKAVLVSSEASGKFVLADTDPEARQEDAEHAAAQDPARTLRRVEADRRVLARHRRADVYCDWCNEISEYGEAAGIHYPCPDLLDLAARYDVEVTP